MIIPFRLQEHGLEEFIVCPPAPTTVDALRERMLQRARVTPGSYACRFVEDLHFEIFTRSLDLKADYTAYFSREYSSFGEYVRRRTRMPSSVVEQIITAVDTSSGVYHVKCPFSYLSDANSLEMLTRLLEDSLSEEAS